MKNTPKYALRKEKQYQLVFVNKNEVWIHLICKIICSFKNRTASLPSS